MRLRRSNKNNPKYKSNTSINSNLNRSVEVIEKRHARIHNMKPVRYEDKKNLTAELEQYNKYNEKYIRGFYTDKASVSNDPEPRTAPSDNKLAARNLKTQADRREGKNVDTSGNYENVKEGNKRYALFSRIFLVLNIYG